MIVKRVKRMTGRLKSPGALIGMRAIPRLSMHLLIARSYVPDGARHPPVFPFHWCCLEILARVLTGSPDVRRIDKDALYSVMSELVGWNKNRLDLDYGSISGCQEEWVCVPGEEVRDI
jgi:hypothetical protein